jgi:hypothetical protein
MAQAGDSRSGDMAHMGHIERQQTYPDGLLGRRGVAEQPLLHRVYGRLDPVLQV